jgi:hypothetical protein
MVSSPLEATEVDADVTRRLMRWACMPYAIYAA